ncbi:MAG: 6-hydroxymethylpterin diphosphokinase MptE-like protein [Spirochaetota bacterium]
MEPELVLEDTPDGLQVVYHGRRLYGRNPRTDARRRVASRTIPPDSLILWCSPLVWHGLEQLLDALEGTSTILACEADPVLFELARRYLPARPGTDRVRLVQGDLARVVGEYRLLGQSRYRRVIELTTSGAALINRVRYRLLFEALDREIRVFFQNRITLSAFARLWLHNVIDNLPAIATARGSAPRLGATVVCGAGPSLESALPLIRRHRNLVTVVAVDTALPVLAGNGIVPDLVIALEGQLANLYDFLPVPKRDYTLVTDLTSNPETARMHERTLWTLTTFAPISLMDRVSTLPGISVRLAPLGSVGVSAVSVAMRLGSTPLLLTGLDFAVRPGTTHARGAPGYVHELVHCGRLRPAVDRALGARLIPVDGSAGTARTTYLLRSYADELAAVLRERSDCYVIDGFGPRYGGAQLSIDQADAMLAALPARPPSVPMSRHSGNHQRDARSREIVLREFIEREIDELEALDLSDPHLERLPEECDYLACDLSDRIRSMGETIELEPLDQATRVRLEAARRYYLSRWRNAIRRLTRKDQTTPRC